MRIGIGYAEPNHDFIDKWGIGQIKIDGSKIGTGVKHQLVNPRFKIVVIEDRCIEPTIRIGGIPF